MVDGVSRVYAGLSRALEAFGDPWLISSGWALDLFVGRVSRVHHDVNVVIPRSAVAALRRYLTDPGWKLVLPFKSKNTDSGERPHDQQDFNTVYPTWNQTVNVG